MSALKTMGVGVEVVGIGKSFGAVTALRDVSFEVGRGEVVALLGPNGAGKTTTVEILSTLTKPDRGHARVAGHDVVTQPAMVRRSIMLTGQHVALDEVLTGYENLVMFGRLQGLKRPKPKRVPTTCCAISTLSTLPTGGSVPIRVVCAGVWTSPAAS